MGGSSGFPDLPLRRYERRGDGMPGALPAASRTLLPGRKPAPGFPSVTLGHTLRHPVCGFKRQRIAWPGLVFARFIIPTSLLPTAYPEARPEKSGQNRPQNGQKRSRNVQNTARNGQKAPSIGHDLGTISRRPMPQSLRTGRRSPRRRRGSCDAIGDCSP
jgi:hypothetical protein